MGGRGSGSKRGVDMAQLYGGLSLPVFEVWPKGAQWQGDNPAPKVRAEVERRKAIMQRFARTRHSNLPHNINDGVPRLGRAAEHVAPFPNHGYREPV